MTELVDVEAGCEAALEAALAGALDMLVVADVEAGRALIGSEAANDGPAENLLALSAAALAPGPDARKVPTGRPLADVVTSRNPAVAEALSRLLSSTVLVADSSEAISVVAAHPGIVAVTRSGGRFAGDGWRLGAGRAGVTRSALAEARSAAESAAGTVARADAELAEAAAAARDRAAMAGSANAATRDAADRRAAIERELRDEVRRVERAQSELDSVTAAIERSERSVAADTARAEQLEALLPALEAEESESARAVAAATAVGLRLQEQADDLAARRAELDTRAAELDERRRQLSRRRGQAAEHLATVEVDGAAGESRRAGLEAVIGHGALVMGYLEGRASEIEVLLAHVRDRRDRHARSVADGARRLDELRARRHDHERRLEEVRERLRRVELEEAEARMRLEAAVEALRRELEVEPEAATAAGCPPVPAGSSPTSRARELERELRLMGQVNPLALEELAALQERHAFLAEQLDDVKGSRRELARVIRAVEAEMTELLAAAYADVEEHFAKLFETLFPGGRGKLTLTDPEHVLESGIEVDARPAGKNVRKLSLLSGGERSLVALAFLFAVFRSRPSPFYLLDEVEAALDDLNLHRFIDLLDEFRSEAQLLVVTHQKRTMEAADCLYGVTMQPGGTSRVLSERVAAAS